jgi:SnoaL-like polyketide cyclase
MTMLCARGGQAGDEDVFDGVSDLRFDIDQVLLSGDYVTIRWTARGTHRGDLMGIAPRRWPWARLLQRVFGFDVLVCDRCGGRRRILGAVTEPHAVRRLLAALGLAPEPPPGRPAVLRQNSDRSVK